MPRQRRSPPVDRPPTPGPPPALRPSRPNRHRRASLGAGTATATATAAATAAARDRARRRRALGDRADARASRADRLRRSRACTRLSRAPPAPIMKLSEVDRMPRSSDSKRTAHASRSQLRPPEPTRLQSAPTRSRTNGMGGKARTTFCAAALLSSSGIQRFLTAVETVRSPLPFGPRPAIAVQWT